MSTKKTILTIDEATKLVDQWIKISNVEGESGEVEIEIDGEIGYDWWTDDDSNTAKAIKAKLKEVANAKATKINVRINSLGGYVHEGLAIHDALAVNPAEVLTDIQGVAASMATVIAQSGNRRIMSGNALYLVHQVSSGAYGNINEMEAAVEDMKAWNDRLVNIYVKRTGMAEAEIRELMNRDNGNGVWIDADEALKMGLIDEIYEPMKMAASAKKINMDPERFRNYHLPEVPEGKRLSTKKENTMSDDKKTLLEKLTDMKDEIRNLLGLDSKEEMPKDIAEKLTEFNNRVEAAEKAASDATAEVERLTAEQETTTSTLSEREAEVTTLTNRVQELEGELTKKNAGSTKLKAAEGLENAEAPVNEEMKALNADAEKIRNELLVPHADDHEE